MPNKAPSYHLSACPMCSSLTAITRPVWRLARHCTASRGHNCYMLVGCQHVAEVADLRRVIDDAEEWERAESAWAKRADQLLTARIGKWSAHAQDGFRRALADQLAVAAPSAPLPSVAEHVTKALDRVAEAYF